MAALKAGEPAAAALGARWSDPDRDGPRGVRVGPAYVETPLERCDGVITSPRLIIYFT